MGKWDRRRRFFRQQRPPPSPPRYDLDERLPDYYEDGMPLWEKEFCTVVGRVPWRKIVDTKSFMCYTHANVFSWDDTAGEQAFQDAKRLYWAKINCISSDVSLPDPDMYIDEIDWNPEINPELIEDLEREYFAPDDEDKETDEECKNKRVQNSWQAKNNSDPWDSYCSQKSEVGKHKTWGDCSDDKQWGSNNSHANQSRDWWGTADTNWNHDSRDGWDSWANHARGWNQQGRSKLDNEAGPWRPNVAKESSTFWKKGQGDSDRNPPGSRQQGNHNVWSRSFHCKQTSNGQDAWSGGCRKRDSSHQYGTDQRNFRPRHDYDQAGRYQGGKANKKVSFAPDYRMRYNNF